MRTYAESMAAGLEAHRRSAVEREEIAAIFEELDSQIRVETNQAMRVIRAEDVLVHGSDNKRYILVAINCRSSYRDEIGRIEESSGGYPVTVLFADTSHTADNADDLKHALNQLLSHPCTGGTIKWVLLGRSPDGR